MFRAFHSAAEGQQLSPGKHLHSADGLAIDIDEAPRRRDKYTDGESFIIIVDGNYVSLEGECTGKQYATKVCL
jgi:hypothetical protein